MPLAAKWQITYPKHAKYVEYESEITPKSVFIIPQRAEVRKKWRPGFKPASWRRRMDWQKKNFFPIACFWARFTGFSIPTFGLCRSLYSSKFSPWRYKSTKIELGPRYESEKKVISWAPLHLLMRGESSVGVLQNHIAICGPFVWWLTHFLCLRMSIRRLGSRFTFWSPIVLNCVREGGKSYV